MKDSLSSHFGQLACWVRSHASNALVIASTLLVSCCHIVLLWLFSGHDLVLYLSSNNYWTCDWFCCFSSWVRFVLIGVFWAETRTHLAFPTLWCFGVAPHVLVTPTWFEHATFWSALSGLPERAGAVSTREAGWRAGSPSSGSLCECVRWWTPVFPRCQPPAAPTTVCTL